MLSDLQQQLANLYQVDTGYCIDDFLITDPAMASVLGENAMLADTDETVLVNEDDDGMSLSVYLDQDMLQRLVDQKPLESLQAGYLRDFWTVLEGVSHFTCLTHRAHSEKPVTLLELELQAEVDKFVATWLLAAGQGDTALLGRLHGWLFDHVSFHPDLDTGQQERYRAANCRISRWQVLQPTLLAKCCCARHAAPVCNDTVTTYLRPAADTQKKDGGRATVNSTKQTA